MNRQWTLRFLGVGNAQAVTLGSASAVLERDGAPVLMIDCGQEGLTAYVERHGAMPIALFVTHAHLDHVAGFERLYYATLFDAARRGKVRIYCAAALVPILQSRLADYPSPLAEGGANFWDAFQLVPVTRGFWHEGLWFDVFAVRHHAPGTAFGLALRGAFLWSGDTRPIPEAIAAHADDDERIAHDCALQGNPSHTGLDDLIREYDVSMRARMILYHYACVEDAVTLEQAGLRVARADDAIELSAPWDGMRACERAWRTP
ncbi:MAG: MBL fold metallo-hydrolase [Pseudomonadota bacterium]|nr:MBL fold metallo-hydrolase [Pseudomonadota bacterium]